MSDRPRVYNQDHAPRKYTPGKRRVSMYVAWSYPAEANADPTVIDNRFSTMTEVRRVGWPEYEEAPYGKASTFSQGIAGSLELFFRAWVPFQRSVHDATGHPVPVFQRVDQAGYCLPIDERILDDTDTLLVFGLDHMVTNQEAESSEIEALREFVSHEHHCLIIGPHHDVGTSDDLKVRAMEHAHHGDPLVPPQQRFGKYTRSLIAALGLPVENRFGLRPATLPGTNKPVALNIDRSADIKGWLEGVDSFNFHMHMPHYAVTSGNSVRVLARQAINLSKPHPFTEAGNREFNICLWAPPEGKRAGEILFVDSTVFSTLFGADKSLERFWRNLATAK